MPIGTGREADCDVHRGQVRCGGVHANAPFGHAARVEVIFPICLRVAVGCSRVNPTCVVSPADGELRSLSHRRFATPLLSLLPTRQSSFQSGLRHQF